MKISISLFVIVLNIHYSLAQTPDDYLKIGQQFYETSNYDSSIIYLNRALDLYAVSQVEEILMAKFFMSNVLRRSNQVEASYQIISGVFDSLEVKKIANDSLVGMIYHEYAKLNEIHLNNLETAKKYYTKSIQFFNYNKGLNKWMAQALSDIGYLHLLHNELDSSLYYQEKALTLRRKLYPENHLTIAASLQDIGGIHFFKGNYPKVQLIIKEIIKIHKLQSKNMSYNLSSLYTNICIVESHLGNFHKAIEYANQGLALQKKLPRFNYDGSPYLLYKMAIAYRGLKDYENAESYFHKSINITKNENQGINQTYADANAELGRLYVEQGNSTMGLKKLSLAMKVLDQIYEDKNIPSKLVIHESIALAHDLNGNYKESEKILLNIVQQQIANNGQRHHDIAKTYLNLGRLFKKQEQSNKALGYYQKALKSLPYDSDKKLSYADNTLLAIMIEKAQCQLSKSNSLNTNELLKRSLVDLKTADSVVLALQQFHKNYDDKISLLEDAEILYNELVALSYILFQKTGDDLFANEIYHFSNRAKSVLLEEHLTNVNAMSFARIPDSLIIQEKQLKFDISYLTSQLHKSNLDSANIINYESKVFKLNMQLEELKIILAQRYPNYFNLKYDLKTSSIKEVQHLLATRNQSIIEYFIGKGEIYVSVINKNSFHIKKISISDNFNDKIAAFNKAIKEKNAVLYTSIASELYNIIFKPVESLMDQQRLIILPDGVLWHLNFDLLLTSNKPTKNYKELDYLLKDYAISYAYSANLLFQEATKKKSNNKEKQSLLAFSFSNSDNKKPSKIIALSALRSSSSEDLPGSREEVRAISDIFEGQYYYGQSANEANFKANADNYSILHLALHGEIDDVHPSNSKLHFTQNKDSLEDGYLYAYELYNMSLNADLAVLSACNTGSGKLVKGEGIMSLGRAFTYAGCKSLVLTQWEVPDATTPQIMKDFYQGLKEGLTKDEALRQAKLSHLETADKLSASPLYWGSFVLLGDNSEIDIENNNNRIVYGSILLVLGILIFLFIRNRRHKSTA